MTQQTVWRKLCKAATLELDPARLQKRIEAAHAAFSSASKNWQAITMATLWKSSGRSLTPCRICASFKK